MERFITSGPGIFVREGPGPTDKKELLTFFCMTVFLTELILQWVTLN